MKKRLLSLFSSLALFSDCAVHAVEVQGHRGSRGTLPENTLPAFEAAIQAGVDVLELDLLVSKDGVVVIHHDFFTSLERCCYDENTPVRERALIRSWTVDQIKELDCGSKMHSEFPEQALVPHVQIPTLQELFDLIRNSPHANAERVRLNLELKRDPRYPEYTPAPREFAAEVLALVKKNGFEDRVYYSSFDPEVLMHLRQIDPEVITGFIFEQETLDYLETQFPGKAMDYLFLLIPTIGVQIISPQYSFLKSVEDVNRFQRMGLRVVPWTVNDPDQWEMLIAMGVDGLITDYPARLVQFIKSP